MLAIADDKADKRCMACQGELGVGCVGLPCPHCGALIKHLVDGRTIDLDELIVCEDAYCRGCGYNLRTLAVSSQCPECGGRVVDSLAERALCYSDQRWLKRVHSGTNALMIGLICLPTWMLVVSVVDGISSKIALSVFVFFLLFLASGSMRIGHVEPRLRARTGIPWPNLLAMVLPHTTILAFFGFEVFHLRMSDPGETIFASMIVLAVAVNMVSMGLCLRTLAVRQELRKLARRAVVAFVATAIAVCVPFALEMAETVLRFSNLGRWYDNLPIMSVALLGIGGLTTLWVVVSIRDMLGEARGAAKRVQASSGLLGGDG